MQDTDKMIRRSVMDAIQKALNGLKPQFAATGSVVNVTQTTDSIIHFTVRRAGSSNPVHSFTVRVGCSS